MFTNKSPTIFSLEFCANLLMIRGKPRLSEIFFVSILLFCLQYLEFEYLCQPCDIWRKVLDCREASNGGFLTDCLVGKISIIFLFLSFISFPCRLPWVRNIPISNFDSFTLYFFSTFLSFEEKLFPFLKKTS